MPYLPGACRAYYRRAVALRCGQAQKLERFAEVAETERTVSAPIGLLEEPLGTSSIVLDDAPEMVADPSAVAPGDWDADEDGEWEAPLVKNADCEKFGCGEWKAPQVSNPAYKGHGGDATALFWKDMHVLEASGDAKNRNAFKALSAGDLLRVLNH